MNTPKTNPLERLKSILSSSEAKKVFDDTQVDFLVQAWERLDAETSPVAASVEQLKDENNHYKASMLELMNSRNILRSLFDNLPDSLYVIDRDYRIVAINNARAQRAEAAPRDLVGKHCYEAFFNQPEPCSECKIIETFDKKKLTIRSKREFDGNGEAREWEINSYPIIDQVGGISQMILVEKDVTERRRMEVMVSQSEKMAAVGQLAAGLAHEINNPLTVVLANAQILMRELPDSEDWRELAHLINTAGARALETVKNLLDYARVDSLEFESIDVNTTIERALEMVRHASSDAGVDLNFQPEHGLPLVSASARNLQSVWVNLVMNALDAVQPGSGKITIKASKKNHTIQVSVTDNGRGIRPDQVNHILEPFFTTKDPGDGTGLGLSICHRIIKQHAGQIDVKSREGKGTTFTVTLPL